jgi:ATP-dependent Clp protease adapter protein ClpS
VAAALIEVFSWDEVMANDVMMQAHTNGYAVTGEYMQDVAEEYCGALTGKGLLAEVVASADMKGGEGEGEGSPA